MTEIKLPRVESPETRVQMIGYFLTMQQAQTILEALKWMIQLCECGAVDLVNGPYEHTRDPIDKAIAILTGDAND